MKNRYAEMRGGGEWRGRCARPRDGGVDAVRAGEAKEGRWRWRL
jgi:hypothetical protein